MFVIALGSRVFRFLVSCFYKLSLFWTSSSTPPQAQSVSHSSFRCYPASVILQPFGVVVRCWRGEAFSDLMIKSNLWEAFVSRQ